MSCPLTREEATLPAILANCGLFQQLLSIWALYLLVCDQPYPAALGVLPGWPQHRTLSGTTVHMFFVLLDLVWGETAVRLGLQSTGTLLHGHSWLSEQSHQTS